jgi:hypothetical protein
VIAAVLILLGVNLAVILLVVFTLLRRRRSITGRRDAFKGKLRVVEGEVEGVSAKWIPGYGHWVHDVLVWNKAPWLLQTALIPVDGTDASGIRAGTVSNLGKRPIVAPLLSDRHSRLELATAEEDRDAALGPFAHRSSVGSLVRARTANGGPGDWNDS